MTEHEHLVTTDWLEAHLDDPDVQVVDCRFDLFDEQAGYRAYQEGHIPGASFLSLEHDLASEPGERGRHPLPEPHVFEAAVRRAGIGRETHVIAYDEHRSGGASRLWWLLRHFGHDRVSVLEGGLEGYDGSLEAGVHLAEPGDFEIGPVEDDTVDADFLLESGLSDANLLIIDARGPTRYRGEEEPIDPVAGHIPGAVNLPFFEAWPVPREIVSSEQEIVVYCGSGVTATSVLLSLAGAGRTDAKLYPGSWSEWSRRGLPVVCDDER